MTSILHCLLGTYELLTFRNLSGQLSRRSIHIHFPRYQVDNTDCSHHQKTLQTACPHCHQKIHIFSSLSRPGYYSKCGQWLGILSNSSKISKSELSFSHYQVCGDFLAVTSYLSHIVDHLTIAKSLQYYSEQLTDANIAAFARFLNIPKNKVWMWQQGQVIQQFDGLSKCWQKTLALPTGEPRMGMPINLAVLTIIC